MDQSPRVVALIIILLFIFFSPDPQSIRRAHRLDYQLREELKQRDLAIIANLTYASPVGLNLTGFRADDGYQWQLLKTAQEISRKQAQELGHGPVYQYLDGEIRGKYLKQQVVKEDRHLNLSDLAGDWYWTHDFSRNITEDTGDISLVLQGSAHNDGLEEMQGTLSIYTKSSPGSGWEASLQGVHFGNGTVILTTASRKFDSWPAFPQFALDKEQFKQSQTTINRTVTRFWDDLPAADAPTTAIPSCELIVWLHQKPLTGSARYINEIEDELRHPEGAPIGTPPQIETSAVLFSPDCGYILEAGSVVGPKSEMYWASVEYLLSALIFVVGLQMALLKREMERCASPSTRSRISYYSIGIAALGDGLLLFSMIGVLMVEGNAFLLFATAAFICTIHVAFLEVKFVFDIWTVQVGDPMQAQRQRQRRTTTNRESLPPPVTAPNDGAIVIVTPDQDQAPRASFASLYSKFYFGLVNLIFFSLWATSWPQNLRAAYINTLSFLYLSMWVPQICRNILRNCRKALRWEYVIGSSILRMIPIIYWHVDENNVLAAQTNRTTAVVLLAWVWFQIMILLSQQFLGPRLLVKDQWCPPAYDYHPVLFDDLEAGGLPIGEVTSASEAKEKDDKSRKIFDCAICMNEINVPVVSKDQNPGRSWLEQRNYMVTPCRHIFHTDCLEGWMNLRLVCPVCRDSLPPL